MYPLHVHMWIPYLPSRILYVMHLVWEKHAFKCVSYPGGILVLIFPWCCYVPFLKRMAKCRVQGVTMKKWPFTNVKFNRNSTSVKCTLSTIQVQYQQKCKNDISASTITMAFEVGKRQPIFSRNFLFFATLASKMVLHLFFCEFFLDFLICTDTVQLGEGMESR